MSLQVNCVVRVGKTVHRGNNKKNMPQLEVNMVKMALSQVHGISVARSKTWYPFFYFMASPIEWLKWTGIR